MDNNIIEITKLDGETQKCKVNKLNVFQRNELFNKYLKISSLMNKSEAAKLEIHEMIKDDQNILDFMSETIGMAIPTLKLDDIEGSECDRIFGIVIKYSVGLGDKKN